MATEKESGSDRVSLFRVILYVYNIILIFLGLCCAGVGIWMHAYKNLHAYFFILRRNPGDQSMLAASGLLIVAGLIIVIMASVGIHAMRKRIKWLFMIYAVSLLLIMLLQLTAGFLIVHLRHDIHRHVKESMKTQIKEHYEFDNDVGKAWNRVQVMRKCCGADGSWDYRHSSWWFSENPGYSEDTWQEADEHVPNTCCVLTLNQDRDLFRVDPQNVQPKDDKRCQEDAMGSKDGSDNLHGRGCFAALLDFIYLQIHLIMGAGIAIGFIQIVGLVCSFIHLHGFKTLPK